MVYKMKLAEISEIELDDGPFAPRGLTFTKLHGNGNDFVLIDARANAEHLRDILLRVRRSSRPRPWELLRYVRVYRLTYGQEHPRK